MWLSHWRERIALRPISRNNVLMSGRSQNSFTKPVVVVRKRAGSKSAVPSAAKPAAPKTPLVTATTQASQTHASPSASSSPTAPVNRPAPKSPPPEDPAVVAARRAARIATIQTVLKQLMDRWPQTFSAHPVPVRPLATGIGQIIAAQLPEVSKSVVHQAIAFWQRQRKTAYLQMLIAGGPRYDLDGNPHGEVTPEQQQQAREALVAWQANRQEKRRAASQQPRSSTSSERSTDGPPQDPPTATD
jgi:ProP effector